MSAELTGSQRRRLERLLSGAGEAAYALDLTGLDLPHALASIDQMAERQRFRSAPREVRIHLDPPAAADRPSLFPAVGRHLVTLMRRGLVVRCRPLPLDKGSGFLITLPARKAAREG